MLNKMSLMAFTALLVVLGASFSVSVYELKGERAAITVRCVSCNQPLVRGKCESCPKHKECKNSCPCKGMPGKRKRK